MAVEGQRFMTKTQHYRKVTKPLLERKRRARMNLYLDELKDLIVDTMEEQGEHVNKLEKADILELTVNYLKAQKRSHQQQQQQQQQGEQQQHPKTSNEAHPSQPPAINFDKFRAGYTQAAYEVSHIFSTLPGLDLKFGTQLMKQLGHQLKDMKQNKALTPTTGKAEPEHHELSADEEDVDIEVDMDDENEHEHAAKTGEDVWRPW